MENEPRTVAIEPRTWHRAERPGWDCVICHLPWPCAPAKVELAEEFTADRLSGAIYLAMSLHDAIGDSFHRAGPEPADLWNRFLGWYLALRLNPTDDRQPAVDGIIGMYPSVKRPSQAGYYPKDSR